MNWLETLRSKPESKSEIAAPGRPKAAPAPDFAALRSSCAAASSEEERRKRDSELGAALGAANCAPEPGDATPVWVAAACHAADRRHAAAWLERLDDESDLAQIARHARHAEVRLAAVRRVDSTNLLEDIARHSRNVDKAVYRHCADILAGRRDAVRRAQHCDELASALRSLLQSAPVSITRLLEIERDAKSIEAGEALPAALDDLLARANARVRSESEQQRKLQELMHGGAALCSELKAVEAIDAQRIQDWHGRAHALDEARATLPAWLDGSRLDAKLLEAQLALQGLLIDLARYADAERFLDAHGASPIDDAAQAAWDALAMPEQSGARRDLQERWNSLASRLRAMPDPPPARPEPARVPRPAPDAATVEALSALEAALDAGRLAEAEEAARRIKDAGGHLGGRLETRLHKANARLAQLRGWAKWGASEKRDELVAAAEELATRQASLDEIEATVVRMREQWKELNPQAPSTKSQWQRFDTALTRAYAPVAQIHAKEAERRAQALSRREEMLAQFESFVAAVVWDAADYPALDARRVAFQDSWRGVPHAGHKQERALNKRADAALKSLGERLDSVRGAERDRRLALIAHAEALQQNADLRAATLTIKSLQEQWQAKAGPLRLARGDEQALWMRFRKACDAHFARRDTERAHYSAQRKEQLRSRENILETFSAAIESAQPTGLKRAQAQFRDAWAAARNLPTSDELERRARQVQKQCEDRLRGQQRDSYRRRLEDMAQSAAPIEGLDGAGLEQGRMKREQLLLDMEIALDLPSPEPHRAARQRRRLEQLAGHFRSGTPSNESAETLLARMYAVPAAPDSAVDSRVAAIVLHLVERAGPQRRG